MPGYIRHVTFDCPDARAAAAFYAQLMSMPDRYLDSADRVVIGNTQSRARLAFVTVPDYRPPTWPESAYPQQLHLCGPTCVFGAANESPNDFVLRLGATRLADLGGDCPVYADPAGHPFCLCAEPPSKPGDEDLIGQMGSVVFDCFDSPRTLATFYSQLLDMPVRMDDEEGWVVIRSTDWTHPTLGFQAAQGQAPRWGDPTRPRQLQLEIEVDDLGAAEDQVLRLGASNLRAESGDGVVYADPEGHPFTLCASPGHQPM